jgi:hypothetical protein
MQKNVAEGKIEIDIPETDEWVERIGKTAYEMLNNNHIKLKTLDSSEHTGLIIESNAALGYIGWAIEKHLDEIPSQLKPAFQEILADIKSRKEDLKRP